MASNDLFLRSDADKGETSPDKDLRLRSDADKTNPPTFSSFTALSQSAVLKELGFTVLGQNASVQESALATLAQSANLKELGFAALANTGVIKEHAFQALNVSAQFPAIIHPTSVNIDPLLLKLQRDKKNRTLLRGVRSPFIAKEGIVR